MTTSRKKGRTTLAGHRPAARTPLVRLEADRKAPMYEQLYRALRDRIVRGELRAGARLTSTRALAVDLGVSRFTVISATERLLAEGYLTARHGSGTFVVDTLPEDVMQPDAPSMAPPRRVVAASSPALSARGQAVSAVVITGPRSERHEPRPFRPRRPALDLFPSALWAKLVRRQWRRASHHLLDYGDPAGYWPLRKAIAEHIGWSRGVRCAPEQVIVTSGAQQAFDVVFRLLLDPGDQAWIEEPGYLDVRAALVAAGAALVPVPVDDQGIVVREGMRRAGGARLAIVSPSHQYPSGATLSATRRAALLDWARNANAWIVEDDYDSHFRYRGRPFLALQRSDMDAAVERGVPPRVIYVGTFSKTMFPALRLGFCVVPEAVIDAATNARAVAGRNSAIVDQAALAQFINDGHYDRHLRRTRVAYRERYEAMQFHVRRELGGLLSLTPASAGTHVLAWFEGASTGRDESVANRVSRAAADAGLVAFSLSRYCVEPPARDGLVLGYGGLTPRRIGKGAERLAAIIEGVVRPRRGTRA